jgi:hypothetical protein
VNFEGLIGWGLQSGSLVLKFIFLSGDFERNMILHLIALSFEMGPEHLQAEVNLS